ncbi:MAG: hypothetical protein M1819_004065 [Sarea resinae]|nr:MAG: hypothetical protein M1819_004065 [Sarea resinae]
MIKRSRFPDLIRRISSTQHYHTFPTKPPASRGRPPSPDHNSDEGSGQPPAHSRNDSHTSAHDHESPLPTRQLAVLAVIALAEQTALNSISPYLPEMASTFPEVDENKVGLYVGLIASSFALAQFATNFFWGWLSDRVGRKPVILLGTLLTSACFVAFGFCRTLWQAMLVQAFMGLVNGNQGVVSTCLGEITDRSNQSRAFIYLPVVYGIGGITGPAVGGLLVFKRNPFDKTKPNPYPYLAPNLLASVLLLVDLVVTMFFMEESLEQARDLPPLGERVMNVFTWLWQFSSSTRPSYLRHKHLKHHRRDSSNRVVDGTTAEDGNDDDDNDEDEDEDPDSRTFLHMPRRAGELTRKQVFNRDTILLLATYLIFQLSNISYNSLYPIFAQGPPPTGRNLSTQEIGLSLSFSGIVTIIFQVGLFGKLREKLGNRTTYRLGLGGFVIAFLLMPWVGYKDPGSKGPYQGKVWLWLELGSALLIKTVAAVGGLTSALLLITNSAPNHSVLGTLNGLAQTLSAAGRAAGPFLSGGLFSLATNVKPKGEALAWGVFGGVAFVGLLMSFGIRGQGLEAEGWDEESGTSSEVESQDTDEDGEASEHTGLLRRK